MITKARDRALSLGGKIHPLLGPIFTTRPASEEVGDPCTMCVDDNAPAPSDTVVRDADGRKAFLCLEHDLMLQEALLDRQATLARYEALVLDSIMRGAGRPWWMPSKVYRKLAKRAQNAANLWSTGIISSLTLRQLEQEIQRIQDQRILAEFQHDTRNDKD